MRNHGAKNVGILLWHKPVTFIIIYWLQKFDYISIASCSYENLQTVKRFLFSRTYAAVSSTRTSLLKMQLLCRYLPYPQRGSTHGTFYGCTRPTLGTAAGTEFEPPHSFLLEAGKTLCPKPTIELKTWLSQDLTIKIMLIPCRYLNNYHGGWIYCSC